MGRRTGSGVERLRGAGYGVVLLTISPAFASTVSSAASAAFPPREPVTDGGACWATRRAPETDWTKTPDNGVKGAVSARESAALLPPKTSEACTVTTELLLSTVR